MCRTPCEKLDGYVGRWVSDLERAEFESHLAGCPPCRRELSKERRLDLLLRRAAGSLESPPAGLGETIARRVRSIRRRRALAAVSAVAATAALAILCVNAWWRSGAVRTATMPDPQTARTPARVEFAPESRLIAVMVDTQNPDMSIVFLYPTLDRQAGGAEPPADAAPSF
jgi:anti-sigma factor RsiW